MNAIQFIVSRTDLKDCKIIGVALPDRDHLPDDGLLVEVERFAFTANNITYALLGDALKYWELFPAPAGYGNIPVWGFGNVMASRHPNVPEGERLFGYFPMATHLVIEASDVTKRGLRDAAAHRSGVAPVYNAYSRVGGDDAFSGVQGDYQALLRPLFMLSFLVDDFLAGQDFFGAHSVILSSASSKTAFGLAYLLHTQHKPIRVIGLTSRANADFVRKLGCYDEVVLYDEITTLQTATPTAFVDMAGNAARRAELHHHFAERLVYSGRVGLTHQTPNNAEQPLPGVAPAWFFAPDHIRKRAKDWGPGGIEQRFGKAWTGFAPFLARHLRIVESFGPDAAKASYLATLDGSVPPEIGPILSLADGR